MQIDREKCIACQACVCYCPVGAITAATGLVEIDEDECVECNICRAFSGCPTDALIESEWTEQRILRSVFSNPLKPHKGTTSTGRGTEEMKTNDVTNRFVSGEFGMVIEVGRPGVGARFTEFEKICRALAPLNITHEKKNPIFDLIEDEATGIFRKDIVHEKVLSGVIEFTASLDNLIPSLDVLKRIEPEIDTVFSVAVISKVGERKEIPTQEIMEKAGFAVRPNGKTNIGLGRISTKNEEVAP